MEAYAWGSGSYGRLGLGHTRDAVTPQRVSGVLNGCDVRSASCGWYHSAVVTSTGEVATFGSKITKCLGAAVSDSSSQESSDSEDGQSDRVTDSASDQGGHFTGAAGLPAFGEVSRAGLRRRSGGNAGGKTSGSRGGLASQPRGGTSETIPRETDYVPHVLRSFPSRVTIEQVAVGGDMLGAHTLAVSRTGRLYSWGYGPACGLGGTGNVSTPTLVTKFLGFSHGDHSTNRSQEMEPMYGRHSHARYRSRTSSRRLGLQLLRPHIVKAVCGGGFSGALSSDGEVFTFGLSAGGRLGFRTKFRAQLRPRHIETLKEPVADIAAGAGFMLLCSSAGRLISWGDNAKGQLGIGHLQESHEPMHIGRVSSTSAVGFRAVAAGDSHSLALDYDGNLYSWGGEGGPMTGQGQPMPGAKQVDAAFQFRLRVLPHWWVRPCQVRALSGMQVIHIAAGCLHSVALTRDGVLFTWGALLPAGSGGSTTTSPEVAWVPRLLAPSPKLPLVRITSAAAGGWHSIATAVPSCAIDRLLPGGDGIPHDDRRIINMLEESLFDGFITSRSYSSLSSRQFPCIAGDNAAGHEEVRIYLSCAAVRARLSLPDGSDSPVWKALSPKIGRRAPSATFGESALAAVPGSATASSEMLVRKTEKAALGTGYGSGPAGGPILTKDRPITFATPLVAPAPHGRIGAAEGGSDDSDEDEESLMDIIKMRRAGLPLGVRARHAAGSTSAAQVESPAEADEAAGKALRAYSSAVLSRKAPTVKEKSVIHLASSVEAPEQQGLVAPQSKAPPQRRIVPDFSSDSTTDDEEEAVTLRKNTGVRGGLIPELAAPARPRALGHKPIPVFSSDSSSSDQKPGHVPAAKSAVSASARPRVENGRSGGTMPSFENSALSSSRSAPSYSRFPSAASSSSVGRGVHKARGSQLLLPVRNRPRAIGQNPIPVFSSDSSSSNGMPRRASTGTAASTSASVRPFAEKGRSSGSMPSFVPSAPSSSRSAPGSSRFPGTASSSSLVTRNVHSARSSQSLAKRRGEEAAKPSTSVSVPKLGVELSDFGEPVLAMLVRFLHVDSLGTVEVINEEHPLVQREQQQAAFRLKRERSGNEPEAQDRIGNGMAKDLNPLPESTGGIGDLAAESRASQQRASKGMLLRSEVDELRRIGGALGLERLVRLCDQLLLRIDAPGAPALFVPASTLGHAMRLLLSQSLAGPSIDGPDTRILCGSPSPRRRRWGHRAVPSGGNLWAHAFVLCTNCSGLELLDENADGASLSGGGGNVVATQKATCVLQRCVAPRSRMSSSARGAAAAVIRFELDLQDVAAEVVFAWLRYLYIQEDLSLLWPCSGTDLAAEDARVAEIFWMDLLRLAQRLGDWRMELYAQDTLIGALSIENWSQMANFAGQINCRALSEAALMMGVRRLLPAMLRSFKVPTGLESVAEQKAQEEAAASAAIDGGNVLPTTQPVAATIGATATGRGVAALHGQVELQLERHLLSLHTKERHATALSELKRNSPGQFGELKDRLCDSIKSAQQAAEQLQRCVRFFDAQSYEAGQEAKINRRIMWRELLLTFAFIVIIYVTPLRETVFRVAIRPIWNADPPWPFSIGGPLSEYFVIGSSTLHLVALNCIVAFMLLLMLWSGLKGGF